MKFGQKKMGGFGFGQSACETPFTPSEAKSVNEMLLRFKNVSTKFPCKFFFLKNINLNFKTPF